MKALKFIVDNKIHHFSPISRTYELSDEQKTELNSRIDSFHEDTTIGLNWDEIKITSTCRK